MQTYHLIGCGGTGTQFLGPALAYLDTHHRTRNEEWEFLLYDGDNFESSNLARQLFDPTYVGLNKAEALATMYARYPVHGIPKALGEAELKQYVGENSIVFIGVDNYSLRALVEHRALQLKNIVVINAGNELHDGSVQLWVRRGGKNKTPRLSFLHPEIAYKSDDDRSAMTCAQLAELPGGGQLIGANMMAASFMMTALWRLHEGEWKTGWTELQFDLKAGTVDHIDQRRELKWDSSKSNAYRSA